MPALAGAALWLRQKRWVLYWAAVAVILCCRADLGLVGRRARGGRHPRRRASGRASPRCVVGLGWTIAGVIVLDPRAPERDADRRPGVRRLGHGTAGRGPQPADQPDDGPRRPVRPEQPADPRRPAGPAAVPPAQRRCAASSRPCRRSCSASRPARRCRRRPSPACPRASSAPPWRSWPWCRSRSPASWRISRIGRRSITRINVDHRIVASIVAASLILFVQNAPSSPYQQPWDVGRPRPGGQGPAPRRSEDVGPDGPRSR